MATPQVTVGLVVFNGEKYLAAAIESFLNQTYRDFQLVVYDNASTDATQEIATRYAALDKRVRVVRHVENMGALRNWNYAVDHCDTPLFCWAAHDDLREPTFLESLVSLLQQHPEAAMACCDARIIDPDGTPHHVAANTSTLVTTTRMSSAQRVRNYLRGAPESPIFGLYRTPELRSAIEIFRTAAAIGGPLMLWLDIVFLVGFFNRHHIAVIHESLFLFRRGGVSHRIDLYKSMAEFLTALARFRKWLMQAGNDRQRGIVAECIVQCALWRYYIRTICSTPVRRMFVHHAKRAMPMLGRVQARWFAWRSPAFRALARRIKSQPRGTRIILFGAGKHTRRCIDVLRIVCGRRAEIVSVCDDAAASCSPIGSLHVISPDELHSIRPDIILVSTDTYERAMCKRAWEIAPNGSTVWCIYDPALEAACSATSASSTLEMKSRVESSVSFAA